MATNPANRFDDSSAPLVQRLRDALTDVHERLTASETSVARLLANQSAVVDGLAAAITAQFSELFTSADQLVTAIRNADFLSATTATPVTFTIGVEATLLLDAGDSFPFVPSSVVALTLAGNTEDYAFAKVLGWAPSTRQLSIEIFAVAGEAGPHTGVTVEIAAFDTLIMETIRQAVVSLQSQVNETHVDVVAKHGQMVAAAATIAAAAALLETGPVISVNGKPGVVTLQAHEIPLQGGSSSVQAAIEDLPTTSEVAGAIAAAISTAIANLLGGAPAALDTLNELAAALADDENFAATVTAALATKAPQATTYTKSEVNAFVTPLDTRLAALEDGFAAGAPVSASGASVSFTSLDCDDIIVTLDSVTHNSGSTQVFNVLLSTDGGSTYPHVIPMTTAVNASGALSEMLLLSGLREGRIVGSRAVSTNVGGLATLLTSSNMTAVRGVLGAQVNAVRVAPAGGSFDGGTITLSARG